MVVTNLQAVANSINRAGERVWIKRVTNKDTVTYDVNQEPQYTYATTTVRSIVLNVSDVQFRNLGGLIDLNSRRFILPLTVTIEKGDTIIRTEGSGTVPYKVVEFQNPHDRYVAFGARQGDDGR